MTESHTVLPTITRSLYTLVGAAFLLGCREVPTLVIGTPLGFVSVMVIVDALPPPCTACGANALVPVMFASDVATSVAWVACVLLPSEDATVPAGIVLMYVPGVFDSTATVTWH